MRLDKKKLNSAKFMLLSGVKTERDFEQAIYNTLEKIDLGQQLGDRTFGEIWGLQDLQTLIGCIKFNGGKDE